MNYQSFNKRTQLEALLQGLGIIETIRRVIKLNTFPDYDISRYEGFSTREYYFLNSWRFEHLADALVHFNFHETKIFHQEDIIAMKGGWDGKYDLTDFSDFLTEAHRLQPNSFTEHGFDAEELDEFKIKKIRVSSIDNSKREAFYDGVFIGDSTAIDPVGWGVYSLVEGTGISRDNTKVYQQLIGESYLLRNRGDYKLAYFLMYTALENYVNASVTNVKEETRLDDKISILFKSNFQNLAKHEVYTSIVNNYGMLTEKRNIIAHGRTSININDIELEGAFRFVLILIATLESGVTTFEELVNALKSNSIRSRESLV